ncbi:fimbrial protein [Neisseriaceae bacterium TC5R-5]|nr:fimbrial protein [Neisseriaceae bacterium TC5R-5]
MAISLSNIKNLGHCWLLLVKVAPLLMVSTYVGATCYAIKADNSKLSPTNVLYTEPGKGIYKSWKTQSWSNGGFEGLPSTININNVSFQPQGSIIASAISPATSLADNGYDADQVLFRCQAKDANLLYEYYTNNPFALTGLYEDGLNYGVSGGYRTVYQGVVARLTNVKDGKYFSINWQKRQMTNLDRDSQGWILVKVKDFTPVKIELIRVPNEALSISNPGQVGGDGRNAQAGTGDINYNYASGYISFFGPGIGNNGGVQYDGRDASQWYPDHLTDAYIASIKYTDRLSIRRSSSCKIDNVTPYVRFPSMTGAQLNNGQTVSSPIDIDFTCQPNVAGLASFSSSADLTGGTAMAVTIPVQKGLDSIGIVSVSTTASGVASLISDNYGSAGVAQGVSVTLRKQSDGQLVPFAWGSYGWQAVLDGASQTGTVDGNKVYRKSLTATFGKIAGKTVTPGSFKARAEVMIRVQ